jgi:acetoin utilization deacetylase AcuC-like enzyme
MSEEGTHIFYHPLSLEHDTGEGHPERKARIAAVLDRLGTTGLKDECEWHLPEPAAIESIHANHDADYLRSVEAHADQGGGALDADTLVSSKSYEAALRGAGACTEAIDAVMSGTASNAFCINRPPGHHARPSRAMGFCLINNIAVGARHALAQHGLERVFIFDWDVHHGNGTQESFYEDASVYFCSIHQSPLYPGTGMQTETGQGSGEGYTLNLTVPSGAAGATYESLLKEQVIPAMRSFNPQLILISAGFDAHRRDPLAGVMLEDKDFSAMAESVLSVADELCDGKVVAVLEGGYDLEGLSGGVEQLVRAMLAHS